MGRRPRTERIELDDDDRDDRQERATRRANREEEHEMFEEPVFADAMESPLYVPQNLIPDGFHARWVRIEANSAADNVNWSKMTRKGWKPMMRADHPELDRLFPSLAIPGGADTSGGAFIMGGLCLCLREARLETMDRKRVEKETKDALRTVENYVEGGNSMFPRFNQSGPLEVQNARTAARFKD